MEMLLRNILCPEGFIALFNGRDFTGWRLSPRAREVWCVEDGILKSHARLEQWGADLATEEEYQDFVLLVDFRLPSISDSGIFFRQLLPDMGTFGQSEQLNIRSRGGMGQLESFEFAPPAVKAWLNEDQYPRIRTIDPEIGAWHTVILTLVGTTLSVEYDGQVILDSFDYPEGLLSTEPAPIRLQKHIVTEIAGEMSDCPIEFRNLFIKEILGNNVAQVLER